MESLSENSLNTFKTCLSFTGNENREEIMSNIYYDRQTQQSFY